MLMLAGEYATSQGPLDNVLTTNIRVIQSWDKIILIYKRLIIIVKALLNNKSKI